MFANTLLAFYLFHNVLELIINPQNVLKHIDF